MYELIVLSPLTSYNDPQDPDIYAIILDEYVTKSTEDITGQGTVAELLKAPFSVILKVKAEKSVRDALYLDPNYFVFHDEDLEGIEAPSKPKKDKPKKDELDALDGILTNKGVSQIKIDGMKLKKGGSNKWDRGDYSDVVKDEIKLWGMTL